MFSDRLPGLAPNRLSSLLAELRGRGVPVLDLTETNPTRVGLQYPAGLLEALGEDEGLRYDPDPRGLLAAREAVVRDLRRHAVEVAPDQVVLTASTSEAYSLLFKLLCNPGDEVLVPTPGYPLFDHLTRLDGVEATSYALDAQAGWDLDVGAIERACTPRTRAVLIISPANPTGSILTATALDRVAVLCRDRRIALIGDEVFLDYLFGPDGTSTNGGASPVASVLTQRTCLTFGLGGFSKSIGLPQLKLAWIAMVGPAPLVDEASSRLEMVADTYLSVATPVQLAASRLFEDGRIVRKHIHQRVSDNLRTLEQLMLEAPSCSLTRPAGGWSAVVRVPAIAPEEELALRLLEQEQVLITPGYFFDFPGEAFLVLSLLPRPDTFATGVQRTLGYFRLSSVRHP